VARRIFFSVKFNQVAVYAQLLQGVPIAYPHTGHPSLFIFGFPGNPLRRFEYGFADVSMNKK